MTAKLGTDERQHVGDDPSELAGLPGDRGAGKQGANPGEHLRRAVAVVHDGGQRPADLVEGNSAANSYGLRVGLAWWSVAMALAAVYVIYLYRSFRGKVTLEGDGY